jgi:hypothetical protein
MKPVRGLHTFHVTQTVSLCRPPKNVIYDRATTFLIFKSFLFQAHTQTDSLRYKLLLFALGALNLKIQSTQFITTGRDFAVGSVDRRVARDHFD